MPFFKGHTFATAEQIEEFVHAMKAMGREFDGPSDGVEKPPEDSL